MLELNLIKENLSVSEAKERNMRVLGTIRKMIIAVFVLLVFCAVYLHIRVSELKREKIEYLSAIENGRNMYGIEQLEAEWSKYVKELSTIDWCLNSRSQWSLSLCELSSIVPKNVYIASLATTKTQDNKGKVTISAVGILDNKQQGNIVNDFMDIVKKSTYFSEDIKLVSDERAKLDEKEIETFSISMNDLSTK